MTEPEKPAGEARARPVLYYTLTDIELNSANMLAAFGDVLLKSTEGPPPSHDEVFGRALAFVGGQDPDAFGQRIQGHDLLLDKVPAFLACPRCAPQAALAAVMGPSACKFCGGKRWIQTVILPADRLHDEQDMRVRARRMPGSVLVDPHGRPLS
jgi:hypothetical protein